ncbi:MAG: DUF1772 domain-containing protein [Hyphomonadaceae bacterium]|nr:DUF1772 domain-containing protein [Hyphomonadaceae bacterium]
MTITTATPETPPPPGAIPVEKLLTGLRTELQKNEHVIWQGRGSGRAFNALHRGMLIRGGLLLVAALAVGYLLFDNRNPSFNWVAWLLIALLVIRLVIFVWFSSKTPSRQVAMLTTQRLFSIDQLRPEIRWSIERGGQGRAEGDHLDPHPIVVTGTKERGHIKLNTTPRKVRVYPPFVLFNAEHPLELAEKIKQTLKIDQPIEDRTK